MIPDITRKMSSAEFLEYTQNREERYELIEGEIVEMPAPTYTHQLLVLLIGMYLRLLGRGRVAISPIDVQIAGDWFQPDVTFITSENITCEIKDGKIVGSPDLVVEVLSPRTAKNDRVKKFHLYERHGIKEYWIVDPEVLLLEQWVIQEEKYQRAGIYDETMTFKSELLGVEVVASEFLKTE
jgi:Uma2 family endonuclease